MRIRRGQKVRLETPGGGGFGDPATRDPAARRARRAARLRDARGCAARLRSGAGGDGSPMPRARAGGAHERQAIVGIDVGGTFTDLFRFDRTTRTFRPPRCRRSAATRRTASSTASRARRRRPARLDRARHHGRHQHAAGAARAEDRRHHDARLSRRAGNAPARPAPDLGPVGRLRARSPTATCGSKSPSARSPTAPSARAVDAAEVRPRRSGCSRKAREALAIIFINAYANAANERSALEAARKSGRTVTSPPRTRCCPKSASSSAPPQRRSTPICSRSSPPISASSKRRWRAGSGQAAHRAVERRHHVDRDRAPAAGAHRALGPGRRRGRGRGARARPRASTISSPATSAARRSTCR